MYRMRYSTTSFRSCAAHEIGLRFRWEQARELAAVVSGETPGRRSPEEITLFESQGIALEDVAVGNLVYRRAVERGIGVDLEL